KRLIHKTFSHLSHISTLTLHLRSRRPSPSQLTTPHPLPFTSSVLNPLSLTPHLSSHRLSLFRLLRFVLHLLVLLLTLLLLNLLALSISISSPFIPLLDHLQ
ncbi:hypothetical protein TorRG33x02_329980, partial [Trema orientale]